MISKLYKYIATMISVLIIICIIFYIAIPKNERGNQMYIEVYNRDLEHVTNITDIKYNVVRRVFDLDTATFQGFADKDVSEGFIFVLCEDNGKYVYGGYFDSIQQKNNNVSFKGIDFKSILDTDIALDFTNPYTVAPKTLDQLLVNVEWALDAQTYTFEEVVGIRVFINTVDLNKDISWIASFDSQFIITNALKLLKPYLVLTNVSINTLFNRSNKTIEIHFLEKPSNLAEIKLHDFEFETTTTSKAINKAIATIKFNNIVEGEKKWILSTQSYFESMQNDMRSAMTAPAPPPVTDYEIGHALRLRSTGVGIRYFKVIPNTIARPATLPQISYFLGKDNNIYTQVRVNLFSKYEIVENYYLDVSTGNLIVESNSIVTDPIIVFPGSTYKVNYNAQWLFYDKNGLYLGAYYNGVLSTTNSSYLKEIIVPSNDNISLVRLGIRPLQNGGQNILEVLDSIILQDLDPNLLDMSNIILPIKARIFEEEFLSSAQSKAITELVNGRYNENIILNNTNSPMDLKELKLFQDVKVYDKNNAIKQLPVSEIEMSNEAYRVKLGFKRTFFTEVIKYANN